MTTSATSAPSFSFNEWLKFTCIPPRLYAQYLVRKNLRKGEAELRILKDIVPADRAALDVGANKGIYTWLLADLATHVHAFEPNPKAYQWLNRALPQNVSTYPLALSDMAGQAPLFLPQRGSGYSNQMGSLNSNKAESPHAAIPVEVRTLDSFAFENVGFIKIDVEGFEAEVLRGAEETLKQCKPTLLIELEERHTGRPIESSIMEITALGYEARFMRSDELRPISDFNPDADHRSSVGKPSYIFNFIFLPQTPPS
ncbi:MAG: FkbM family methyltransferase [Rhodospirillaceae bacterium]